MERNRNISKASLALSVIGLVVSIYLVAEHYANVPLGCPNVGIINCANVLNSSYSQLFGIPLVIYGTIFFVVEFIILYMNDKEFTLLYNTAGMGFVVYFIYLEYLIGNICIYCTTVHIVVFALFAISLYHIVKA